LERRVGTQHADLWRGLTLVFEKLDTGCAELALPALGSFLWSRDATAEIISLELANRDLIRAIHSLAFTGAIVAGGRPWRGGACIYTHK
jgi:hypothetical protein